MWKLHSIKSIISSIKKHGDYICTNNEDYDMSIIPNSDSPLILKPYLDIYDITEVNEIDKFVGIYIKMTLIWKDPTLIYKNKTM